MEVCDWLSLSVVFLSLLLSREVVAESSSVLMLLQTAKCNMAMLREWPLAIKEACSAIICLLAHGCMLDHHIEQ